MKVDWKEIWEANQDIIVASDLEQCSEEKRKGWHLPSGFSYFSGGDLNLRVGIIASQSMYKEEDLLLGGILWGNRLGNGARTVIYFIAPDFSPVFLGALAKLGGTLKAKAVYWREKLTPSLYPVPERNYYRSYRFDFGSLRPGWDFWQRSLNPVAWNHLKIVRDFFEGLTKRRVRTIFSKNKLLFSWGNIEIAEIKKKGNKFELSTKVKWTRNKNISSKFQKLGWVDIAGSINEEFTRAIIGIIELLENMEVNGSLDKEDHLAIKLMYDREFVPDYFGQYMEFPWLPKEKKDILDTEKIYFFCLDKVSLVNPILEKPIHKVVQSLLISSLLEYSDLYDKGIPQDPDLKWDQKVFLLTQPELKDELRLCLSWLSDREQYPIILLPVEWRTEGLKSLKGFSDFQLEESYGDGL